MVFERNIKVDVILLGSGKGMRFNSSNSCYSNKPKQFILLDGREVISYPIETFEHLDWIRKIIVLVSEEYKALMAQIIKKHNFTKTIILEGSSQESYLTLRKGLNFIKECGGIGNHPDFVIFHDGVRAMIQPSDIKNLLAPYTEPANPNPVDFMVCYRLPLTYEVVQIDPKGQIVSTPLRAEQAEWHYPMIIPYSILLKIMKVSSEIRDRSGHNYIIMARTLGYETLLIPGIRENLLKLTYSQDLIMMEATLSKRKNCLKLEPGHDAEPEPKPEPKHECGHS